MGQSLWNISSIGDYFNRANVKRFHRYLIMNEIPFNTIVGAPCITYPCEDIEEVWNVLCEASTQGSIIIASIQGNNKLNPEEVYKRGLNPLFGNTILDISLTRTSSEIRTIKLRNIWNTEYQWESKHK